MYLSIIAFRLAPCSSACVGLTLILTLLVLSQGLGSASSGAHHCQDTDSIPKLQICRQNSSFPPGAQSHKPAAFSIMKASISWPSKHDLHLILLWYHWGLRTWYLQGTKHPRIMISTLTDPWMTQKAAVPKEVPEKKKKCRSQSGLFHSKSCCQSLVFNLQKWKQNWLSYISEVSCKIWAPSRAKNFHLNMLQKGEIVF